MITFNSETTFNLNNEAKTILWIERVVVLEGFVIGEINYIFCDDTYLNHINKEFLKHDSFTDIISFDYSLGKQINGDIYISIERVLDNAEKYNVTFENELRRVMIHGVLHYMGYKDKTTEEWVALFIEKKIPCGPIYNIKEAVENPQIEFRNMIVSANHNKIGKFKMAGNPIKMSNYEDKSTRGEIPDLDQHRDKILKEFE